MIVYVLLITLCVLIIRFVAFRYHMYRTIGRIPGPPVNFLFGNTLELVRYDTQMFFEKLFEYFNRYGTIVRLDMVNKCWIIFSSVNDVERIISSNEFNRKSTDYAILDEWLGNGILLDHGNSWFTNRRALTGAFHFKILDSYVPVFEEQADVLVRKLLEHGGAPVDVFSLVKLYTLDVILETSMGVRCRAQLEDSDYVRAVSNLSRITFWRMYNVMGFSDWTFRLTKHYKTYRESICINRDFTTSVIKQRRAELVARTASASEAEPKPEKGRLSLLDILLRSDITGRQFSDEEVYSQVNNFMFAGHDTTSSAITFILYACAKYPDVQQRAYEEICAEISSEQAITQQHISNLKYLELVIKESLRMFPPVPYYSRHIDRDTTVGGIQLEKGATIVFGAYMMHHNPEYFPNPDQFRPERFEDSGDTKRNPFVYIPFSAGSRNCIGQKFALNELKTALAKILRQCKVVLPDPDFEPKMKMELVLKPVNGMPLRFLDRKNISN
ncbi:cytochrome P450 4d2-like [Anopheles maculipalpis]|uniref:cytochrome P450 4d2-like n=1 Tax=Anopheles maculipalpis TaxID=1496333 RepID=UPI002158B6C6|nr:cytochrome P450 4d2-like [Anopheles maculipalpis]